MGKHISFWDSSEAIHSVIQIFSFFSSMKNDKGLFRENYVSFLTFLYEKGLENHVLDYSKRYYNIMEHVFYIESITINTEERSKFKNIYKYVTPEMIDHERNKGSSFYYGYCVLKVLEEFTHWCDSGKNGSPMIRDFLDIIERVDIQVDWRHAEW